MKITFGGVTGTIAALGSATALFLTIYTHWSDATIGEIEKDIENQAKQFQAVIDVQAHALEVQSQIIDGQRQIIDDLRASVARNTLLIDWIHGELVPPAMEPVRVSVGGR